MVVAGVESLLSDTATVTHAEVLVATTWTCNLRCSYCFIENAVSVAKHAPMTPDVAARTIDALHSGMTDFEQICLHLYGGEPLSNLPSMKAMVERALTYPKGRFTFAITTNGTLGTPEALSLLDAGKFQVVLSIDGPSDVHDAVRHTETNEGSHARVMEFLNALQRKTCCTVRGSSVVRSGWSLANASAYLRTLPLDVIKAQAVRSPADAANSLSDAEFAAYLDDLDEVGDQVIEDISNGVMPLDDRFSARVLQLLAGTVRTSFCGAGRSMFGINPDGSVLPCVLMGENAPRLGHIDDNPETWLSAGKKWVRQTVLPAKCHECTAKTLCGGGCPAVMPICTDSECEITRKNVSVARRILLHFQDYPTKLLILAGIA